MTELMIESRTALGATGAEPLPALAGGAVSVEAPDPSELRRADADEPTVVRALTAVGSWG